MSNDAGAQKGREDAPREELMTRPSLHVTLLAPYALAGSVTVPLLAFQIREKSWARIARRTGGHSKAIARR